MPPDGARSRPRRRHPPNRSAGAPVPGQFSNLSRRKPSRSASSVLLSMLLPVLLVALLFYAWQNPPRRSAPRPMDCFFCCAGTNASERGWACGPEPEMEESDATLRAAEAALGLGADDGEQRKGCNIPIVDGSTAGWEQILLEHKDEPVIVQGLFDPPPELTHRDQLLREFVSHPRRSNSLPLV